MYAEADLEQALRLATDPALAHEIRRHLSEYAIEGR
jgi:hypothetical protein